MPLSREEELAQLIEEQRRDDTPIIWPEIPYAIPLDKRMGWMEGNEETVGARMVGISYAFIDDTEPEITCFLRPEPGFLLGASWHGTEGGYTNHGCRCPRCSKANSAAHQIRVARARKREQAARPDRTCPNCGERFRPIPSTKIYCQYKCADAASKRRMRARKRAA